MNGWWSRTRQEGTRPVLLIAVLMSATLWTFVAFLPRMESEQRKWILPIQVVSQEGLTSWVAQPRTAEVVLTGPRGLLTRVQEGEVALRVHLPGQHASGDVLPIQVEAPPGMIRSEVTPEEVRLVTE